MKMGAIAQRQIACIAFCVLLLASVLPMVAQTECRLATESGRSVVSVHTAWESVTAPGEESAPSARMQDSLVTAAETAVKSESRAVKLAALSPEVSPSASDVSVSGTVSDPSGAIVAGVTVTLHRDNDSWEQSTTTDAGGEFRFHDVPAGRYELQVEHPGFKIYKTGIKVRIRHPAHLHIVLAVADVKETITVHSLEGHLNTDIADNADVFRLNAQFLEDLPILDDDILGAISKLVLDPASVGTNGATLVVDGMPSSSIGVPVSAIEEVRINKNPYSAEFARPGRGRIEIITKSGSSNYHGSFNFKFRDYRLDARNAFAVDRPQEQRRQFEGYFSGPVSKNTTFLVAASRKEEDLQSIVFAQGPLGLIDESFPRPRRDTYVSAQATHEMGKNRLSFRYNFFDWSDKGEGVGGFGLPDVAADSTAQYHQIHSSYKSVITPKLLNEFLIRIRTENGVTRSRRPGIPRIVVLSSVTSGGAQIDRNETTNRAEFTDVLSWSHGNHLVKMGINVPSLSRYGLNDRSNREGTFYFSSLEDFAQGRPFSFVKQQGNGHLVFWAAELGSFIQDEVRLRPNLSMAFGLRYDWQSHLSARNNHNFAPRFSFAFAPKRDGKTVFRGGAGIFYDTTGRGPIADVLRYNGSRLLQFVLSNPGFPDALALGDSFATLSSSIVRFDPNLRSPYIVQYSFGVERQLQKSLMLTATYIGTRGIDLFRSRDINAPLPPLFLARPDPSIGVLQQIESSGHLEAHALEVALRGNLSRFFTGILEYRLRRTYDNTDGIDAFPANNYDLSTEWSRSSSEERHAFLAFGTFNAGRLFKLGMVFSVRSGRPYSITTGLDDFNDGFANARPPGARRNSLVGPGKVTLDLRWSKEFSLHPGRNGKDKKKGPSMTIGVDAFNVLNRVNLGTPVGNLSSPFFGRSVSAGPARLMQLSLGFKF
jgi:Carboxypeptidase regulatory-like domain/TonB dependent receptor